MISRNTIYLRCLRVTRDYCRDKPSPYPSAGVRSACAMLELALLFFVVALIAGGLGAGGVAGLSMSIAKWLVLVFLVLAVVSLFL